MDARQMHDLDNYITDHYGEDQFRTFLGESRTFLAGRKARRMERPITSCRCRSQKAMLEWRRGWIEEDSDIRESL